MLRIALNLLDFFQAVALAKATRGALCILPCVQAPQVFDIWERAMSIGQPIADRQDVLSAMTQASGAALPAAGPEFTAALAAMRAKVVSTFGRVTMAMAALPRYRHQTLSDLHHLVLEPLIRDRLAIAVPKLAADGEPAIDDGALIGIAIWANVSDAVDAKIREQVKAGTFPVRLRGEDWASGDAVWLLDVIAPNRKLSSAVLANFGSVAGERQVFVHPMVARLVDEQLLQKIGARPA